MRVAKRFQDWLFRTGPLWPLAVCRIFWALAMLLATLHESSLADLYSNHQYHVPLLPFVKPVDATTFGILVTLAAVGGALALLGLFTRFGIALVIATHGYLFALDLLLFRNHVYLGLLIGALLFFSPCADSWSVRAAHHRHRGKPLSTLGALPCAQLIKAQVVIVYGYSALNKLRNSFLDGFVLEQELPTALRSSPLRALMYQPRGGLHPLAESVLHSSSALGVAAALVLMAEAFLTVGLPSRPLRPFAVAVGVVLHTTIFLTMGIHVFGLLMMSSYLLFLDSSPRPLRRVPA